MTRRCALSAYQSGPQGCHGAPVDADKAKEEDEERCNYAAEDEGPEHGRGLGEKCSVRQRLGQRTGSSSSPAGVKLAHRTLAVH